MIIERRWFELHLEFYQTKAAVRIWTGVAALDL